MFSKHKDCDQVARVTIAASLALIAMGGPGPAQTRVPASGIPASEQRAFDLAARTVRERHLLTREEERCSSYRLLEIEGDVATINVHEKHNARCGGDPNTSPRRFTLQVDLKTRAALWDGDNLEAEMNPVPRDARRGARMRACRRAGTC
jgi:hypothetical protein